MSNEKILTKEIAEQFLENVNSVELREFTAIEDEAAEILSKREGWSLYLNGLTSLSDATAKILSKHEGDLDLDDLTSLWDTAAESLSKCKGVRLGLTLWKQYATYRWCVYQIPLLVFGFVMRNGDYEIDGWQPADSSIVIIWVLIFAIPAVWVWRKPIFRFLNKSAK